MAFDECMPYPSEKKDVKRSMERSMRWALRSKNAFVDRDGYGIFGIVQGGIFPDLRQESVKALTEIGFDGYAVGGLAVGEGQELMFQTLDVTTPYLPSDKPRYLMGVGRPSDIVGSVARGIDMFDCVMPTRSGRTALAFTREGTVNIRNASHMDDPSPLDKECSCPACTKYSRAYLHHLFRAGEILGAMLLTWHNIQYYQDLMKSIRKSLDDGKFDNFANAFFEKNKTLKRPL
jgi:queuine tRNA-ribosyltransferase